MKTISCIIILLAQFILLNPAYSANIRDENSFLLDIRNKNNSIGLNRFSISKEITRYDIKASLFEEAQWHFGISDWDKLTSGLEAEKYLLKHIYYGESVHFISGRLLDHMTFDPGNVSVETITKFGFKFHLSERISFKIWNEYSYNLKRGSAGLNEVHIDIPYKVNKNLDVGIGWRHTDRIHAYDSDYAITSFVLHF